MTLRRQLILVSLLLLSLPWAGCQFIREMEGALRHGQEQSLQATARAVAGVVGEHTELLYPATARLKDTAPSGQSIYAASSAAKVSVDGYADGWEHIAPIHFDSSESDVPFSSTLKAVTHQGNLYLLLQVEDEEVVYHNPGLSPEPNGDRLVLRTWQNGVRQDYVIATAAPGVVRAQNASKRSPHINPDRIRGYWQDARGGYSLELEMPLSYTGDRLGFYLVNSRTNHGSRYRSGMDSSPVTLGNISPLQSSPPPWLIYSPPQLQTVLAPFSGQDISLQVVDTQNWLLADLPAASTTETKSETFWLLRLLYRSILSDDSLPTPPNTHVVGKLPPSIAQHALSGSADNQRYRDPVYSSRTVLSAVAPVSNSGKVIGAVVAQQSGEQYLSLTDQAFGRLLGYSMLAIGIGVFGLLAYASLLSWRIGRLSRAASSIVSQDGSIAANFPRSNANDEIGELSRHYADLLDKVREYNDYLRTLSSKLSHELRTPIAVIQTSLENLENSSTLVADATDNSTVYLARARQGLQRLNSILTAMSEASHLEQSIRNNAMTDFDLAPLLQEVFAAYQGVYSKHSLSLNIETQTALTHAVPELIVQALDKLMDNAASFTTAGDNIELALVDVGSHWRLSVSNEGPALPKTLQNSLFEPMVSDRQGDSDAIHLGLGLHIVSLINDYHSGKVYAENKADNCGVSVIMLLPKAQAPLNK